MTDVPDDYEIKIKGGSFALADLGELLPGMAEIMPLIGGRIWKCYYAGKAKNQKLAAFQLKEAVNLLEKGAVLRPKYESEFTVMIDQANAYHEKYDKGFLRWKMPDEAPPDLDLTAT